MKLVSYERKGKPRAGALVDGDRKDTAIRPNQIFAVSLVNSALNKEQQAAVVEVVRRELLTGGMLESRIARVIGLASSVLLNPSDPHDPINRRVSIIVMNKKAEEAAMNDGGIVEVEESSEIQITPQGVIAPAAPPDVSAPHS